MDTNNTNDSAKSNKKNKIFSREKVAQLIMALIIILSSVAFKRMFDSASKPLEKAIGIIGLCLLALLGISLLINLLPDSRIKTKILSIIGFPIGCIWLILEVMILLFSVIIAAIVVFSVPIILFSFANKMLHFDQQNINSIYYISFVSVLTIFSYFKKIIIFITKFFYDPFSKGTESDKKRFLLSKSIIMKIDFRALSYIIGFIVIFITSLDTFYVTANLGGLFWSGIKDIALQGLVTYIALDSCIALIKEKLKK